jgi:hypothetical protein
MGRPLSRIPELTRCGEIFDSGAAVPLLYYLAAVVDLM